jgi:hypothetical protein
MEIEFIENDFIKEEEQLNEDWIINFEKTDKLYQDYYKDSLYYTNLQFIYVNKDNEIDKIKQEPFLMSSPNFISREEIIGILKKYAIDDDKRYTLLSILRYNITLDTEDVKNFVIKEDPSSLCENFFTVIKNIDAIYFEKTINMFQDLNDLIFILYEKKNVIDKRNLNNITKRVYLNRINNLNTYKTNSHKKTIRK